MNDNIDQQHEAISLSTIQHDTTGNDGSNESTRGKTEIHRKPNTEYKHLCIANLFFMFYFQFVCRVNYVQDEDIYDIHPKDKTIDVTERSQKYWNDMYNDYLRKLAHYEEEKENDPKFDIVSIFL